MSSFLEKLAAAQQRGANQTAASISNSLANLARPGPGAGAGAPAANSQWWNAEASANQQGAPAHDGPPGSFPPGTMLSINGSVAMVERFLAEGGFAHVYLVSVSNEPMCVKRIACMDESTLAEFQKEVDFMKKLNGHRNIVQFAGACSHPLKHGGYEMLILMEYCPGGRLVDYLNARLPRRLNEMEVLTIFSDICEGVAYMHMQSPVIVHRDLKVENVLVSKSGTYKLCDFGSATTQLVPPGAQLKAQEIQKLEDEISKFTTLQYRSPEMCDLYQKRGLTEKLDIWALGVLLYKLCYYTTPFEDSGKMAIINVRYSFPTTPVYSPAIQKLIGSMLNADVYERLNIYEVYSIVCRMRGVECRIQNPYPPRAPASTPPAKPPLPRRKSNVAQPAISAPLPPEPAPAAPTITPMRRGRPPKASAADVGSLGSRIQSQSDMRGSAQALASNEALISKRPVTPSYPPSFSVMPQPGDQHRPASVGDLYSESNPSRASASKPSFHHNNTKSISDFSDLQSLSVGALDDFGMPEFKSIQLPPPPLPTSLPLPQTPQHPAQAGIGGNFGLHANSAGFGNPGGPIGTTAGRGPPVISPGLGGLGAVGGPLALAGSGVGGLAVSGTVDQRMYAGGIEASKAPSGEQSSVIANIGRAFNGMGLGDKPDFLGPLNQPGFKSPQQPQVPMQSPTRPETLAAASVAPVGGFMNAPGGMDMSHTQGLIGVQAVNPRISPQQPVFSNPAMLASTFGGGGGSSSVTYPMQNAALPMGGIGFASTPVAAATPQGYPGLGAALGQPIVTSPNMPILNSWDGGSGLQQFAPISNVPLGPVPSVPLPGSLPAPPGMPNGQFIAANTFVPQGPISRVPTANTGSTIRSINPTPMHASSRPPSTTMEPASRPPSGYQANSSRPPSGIEDLDPFSVFNTSTANTTVPLPSNTVAGSARIPPPVPAKPSGLTVAGHRPSGSVGSGSSGTSSGGGGSAWDAAWTNFQ